MIYGSTLEEHLKRLGELLERLRRANLKVNLLKCQFAVAEVTYLGHIVTSEGVKPDPSKLKAVKDFPRPRNAKEVRGFLGLAGYYRRYIPYFADIAKPLTQLVGKSATFNWGKEQEDAFSILKTALCSESVLVYPDFRDPFILATDASNVALGAVLSQIRNGEERPICYASRQLQGPELNYTATEKELLAVVWATKQFRCYLLGRKFTLVTDHSALRWLLSLNDPSSRLTRWALRLAEFDYDVQHKAGKRHTNADALSRQVGRVRMNNYGMSRKEIREAQEKDHWCKTAVKNQVADVTRDADGLLYWTRGAEGPSDWRLMVPESLRERIMTQKHAARWMGHPGPARTFSVMKRSYYWPGMEGDISEFVKRCDSCAKRKSPPGLKAPLETPYFASRPFEQISLDIFGPLPKTPRGNRYLLTVIDNFTRYAEGEPIGEATAKETARVLVEKIVTRHGVPSRLLTDQGRNFVSALFKETCRLLGIKKLQTTPYHPEGNGMVERLHRTLTDSIAHFVKRDGTDWDRWVPYALMAYRAIPHSSTGFSPNFLTFGREVTPPLDSGAKPDIGEEDSSDYLESLQEKLKEAQAQALEQAEKAWAARTRTCNKTRRPRTFSVGAWVYLLVPAVKPGHCKKFHCPWTGPHQVVKALSRVTYEIRLQTGGTTVVHINRLKPASVAAENLELPQGTTDRTAEKETTRKRASGAGQEVQDDVILWGTPDSDDEDEYYVDPPIDREGTQDVAHDCPVTAGKSAECSHPQCPLGGTFIESGSSGSLRDEEVFEIVPFDETIYNDEMDETMLPSIPEEEDMDETPVDRRSDGEGGLQVQGMDVDAQKEAEVSTADLQKTENHTPSEKSGSVWEPSGDQSVAVGRSPYDLRSRNKPPSRIPRRVSRK